jgi:hypothetical protein
MANNNSKMIFDTIVDGEYFVEHLVDKLGVVDPNPRSFDIID